MDHGGCDPVTPRRRADIGVFPCQAGSGCGPHAGTANRVNFLFADIVISYLIVCRKYHRLTFWFHTARAKAYVFSSGLQRCEFFFRVLQEYWEGASFLYW